MDPFVFAMNLHDVVRLKMDLPKEELCAGAVGVIVAIYHEPQQAFEVEFCDKDGLTLSTLALLQEQIEKVA